MRRATLPFFLTAATAALIFLITARVPSANGPAEWQWPYRPSGPMGMGVAFGLVVAAALMLWTGLLLGPDDPTTMLESAAVGTRADAPLEVAGTAVYLAWPMPALVGILIALLSRSD